ncbi:hypothetical protein niasHT_015578 [Heterodera trifolii]|uniref:Ankyrin repeat protein n=1 Tax=Heterodera trifolii TaxID=157864 RepID=A0ABD2LD96_9BILA
MYPLHKAIYQNDAQKIEELCSEAEQTNAKDHHGNTPLHVACMIGSKDVATLLLARGAIIRTKNALGWNALDEAIASGNRELGEEMAKSNESLKNVMALHLIPFSALLLIHRLPPAPRSSASFILFPPKAVDFLMANFRRLPDRTEGHRQNAGTTTARTEAMLKLSVFFILPSTHLHFSFTLRNSPFSPDHENGYFEQMIKLLVVKFEKEAAAGMEKGTKAVAEKLKDLEDFEMTIKWALHLIPFSALLLIHRLPPAPRSSASFILFPPKAVDFLMANFRRLPDRTEGERGDMSLLVDLAAETTRQLVLMDNKKKVFFVFKESEMTVRQSVNKLMTTAISK